MKKITVLITSYSGLFLMRYSAFAAITVTPPSTAALPLMSTPDTLIGSLIGWFIGLVGILAILAITWAGIQMILSVGEDEKIKKARMTMIYAFIGVLIAGVAYGVVTFITGVNLTTLIPV